MERVMFSVDYPFEQINAAGCWFDELSLDFETKLRVGRENARELLLLDLEPLPASNASTDRG